MTWSHGFRKRQSAQHADARLIIAAWRRDQITPALHQLRRLSDRLRVGYRVACLVHQSLSDQAPAYPADHINLVSDTGRCLLRSMSDRTCIVPRTDSGYGDRSLGVDSPRVWNGLPSSLRQVVSYKKPLLEYAICVWSPRYNNKL